MTEPELDSAVGLYLHRSLGRAVTAPSAQQSIAVSKIEPALHRHRGHCPRQLLFHTLHTPLDIRGTLQHVSTHPQSTAIAP